MGTGKCFSCGGEFPSTEGSVHRYMVSSPGCWATYGEILAREYTNYPSYFRIHLLTVDAYAVQHPGSTDRQSIQSVGVHLIRLCLLLEHELAADEANDATIKAGRHKHGFFRLEPPTSMGSITAADVLKARTVEEHKIIVKEWARSSWEVWKPHHDIIRSWLSKGFKQ